MGKGVMKSDPLPETKFSNYKIRVLLSQKFRIAVNISLSLFSGPWKGDNNASLIRLSRGSIMIMYANKNGQLRETQFNTSPSLLLHD